MYKRLALFLLFFVNACTTSYYLMDEEVVYNDEIQRVEDVRFVANEGDEMTQRNVFVVDEGANFVTYQYKEVRVDEISPLASMYCADVASGKDAFLRDVSMFHNGYMRATFDCVNLAM